jgi:hypothetical protein
MFSVVAVTIKRSMSWEGPSAAVTIVTKAKMSVAGNSVSVQFLFN